MSPRSKEQNEEIRKQRVQEILKTAIFVYAEKGYSATEIGEIAERAGMARGLIYHYFENKQKLFRELYEYMMKNTQHFTKSHFEQNGPVIELFREYAMLVCKRVMEEPAISQFYMRIGLDLHYLYTADEFSVLNWIKTFLEPLVQAIEKGINEGTVRKGDGNLMAVQFWGAVSQGMNYLHQFQKEMLSNSSPQTEVKERLQSVLEQVVDSSVAVLRID